MNLDEFVELFHACAHHKYAPLLYIKQEISCPYQMNFDLQFVYNHSLSTKSKLLCKYFFYL
jgi:hypothetical protein